jgi:hypothetical protein
LQHKANIEVGDRKQVRACFDVAVLENYRLRNCSFISQRCAKPWFRKKRSGVEFLKLQKNYDFDSTTVFKTTKFVASKHP